MNKLLAALIAGLFAAGAFAQAPAAKPAAPATAATPATTAAKPATAAAPAAKEAPKDAKVELIDINSADEKTLMTLKGIGDVTAKKIIKSRPYSGKDDLVKKKIVSDKVYADIKDQIIAKQKK